jgi:cytochrome c oxidase cbb3-type subunit 3
MSQDNTQDVVLGHSDEADGIDEYDNRLPRWWLGILYFTVIWGVGYAVHYHFTGGRSQVGDYETEVAAANERWPAPSADEAMALANTPESIEQGKAVYAQNCIGCHGAELKGGIGPNLTDAEWIHGGSLSAISATIEKGVPEKGMLSWGPILGPQKVAQVAAYVHAQGGGQ